MNRNMVDYYKSEYPKGTRIVLDSMGDDPRPVPSGTKGTVQCVDSLGTIHCKFDNGRSLGICPDVDSFHKIAEQTETPEHKSDPKLSM